MVNFLRTRTKKKTLERNTAHPSFELWYCYHWFFSFMSPQRPHVKGKKKVWKKVNFSEICDDWRYKMFRNMWWLKVNYILYKVQFWSNLYHNTPFQGQLLPLTNHSLQGYKMWRDQSISHKNLSVKDAFIQWRQPEHY